MQRKLSCGSRLAVVLIPALLASGCLSAVSQAPKPALSPTELSQYADTSPAQLLATAEGVAQKAHAAEFSFYSPNTLVRMEKALEEMRAYVKRPDADKVQVIVMGRGLEQLYQVGDANKQMAQAQLADVLDQKKALETLNAPQLYPSDYKDAVEDIIDLIGYLETGKPDKVRANTPGVMKDMQSLETRIVKENALNRAKILLAEAKDKDADDNAPRSYEEAVRAYERTVKFVDTNPRERAEITRLGIEATFLAQRSVRLAEEVKKLQQVKAKELEQVALEAEQRMQRIAEAMRHPDVRDQSLHDQSVTLARAAEKAIGQFDKTQAAITESEKVKAELAEMRDKLDKTQAARLQAESEIAALKARLAEQPSAPAGVAQPSEGPASVMSPEVPPAPEK